jgi:hypothetical protein
MTRSHDRARTIASACRCRAMTRHPGHGDRSDDRAAFWQLLATGRTGMVLR